MLKNNKFSIWVGLMLAVILMGSFHPARALGQCGGGDYQNMHQQHLGSLGQMGMGPGQMGMSGQSGQMGMGSGQMGMGNAQAPALTDPNAIAPAVAPVYTPPQEPIGSGQMTGMEHRGHQH
jgi:hypothetical protein